MMLFSQSLNMALSMLGMSPLLVAMPCFVCAVTAADFLIFYLEILVML